MRHHDINDIHVQSLRAASSGSCCLLRQHVYWTGLDIAPSKFQHPELHCLQWSGVRLDQLVPKENMQTYEKCADYIQTHFMLLREDTRTTCKMLSKPRLAALLHCRKASYLDRTTSSLSVPASSSSCKGATLQRSALGHFGMKG